MKDISIIAAISEGNVIGFQNKIPWHIPEDFKRFKALTLNHGVIMGQRTYESILEQIGKPLPKRYSIVLSDDFSFLDTRVEIAHSITEALNKAWSHHDEAFIAGGASVYTQFLLIASRMYLTHIKGKFQGDAFFPEFKKEEWQEAWREEHEKFSFVDYKRIYQYH